MRWSSNPPQVSRAELRVGILGGSEEAPPAGVVNRVQPTEPSLHRAWEKRTFLHQVRYKIMSHFLRVGDKIHERLAHPIQMA